MNYKNHNTGEVISEQCYNRLPYDKRKSFSPSYNSVTHHLTQDDSGSFLTSMLIAEAAGDIIGSIIDSEMSSDSESSFDSSPDFGGGDFGGGGSGGEW